MFGLGSARVRVKVATPGLLVPAPAARSAHFLKENDSENKKCSKCYKSSRKFEKFFTFCLRKMIGSRGCPRLSGVVEQIFFN